MVARYLRSNVAALVAGAVCLVGCDSVASRRAAAERERAAEARKLEQTAQALLAEVMFDPTAILLKDLQRGSDEAGRTVVCGKVNGKNRFGGYVGFRPFVARKDATGAAEVFTDATLDDGSSTPEQVAEALAYRQQFNRYCALVKTAAPGESSEVRAPVRSNAVSAPRAEAAPAVHPLTPITLEASELDPCSNGVVRGLNPRGDGFLSVRTAPNEKARELFRLHNGDQVYVCDQRGDWMGVLHGPVGDACGAMTPVSKTGPYRGRCRSGWAHENWIELWAG
jgi:hypothetical protein